MSVQEEYLRDIAGAIRERDGTAEPIRADTFAERIRGLPSGGYEGTPPDPERVYKDTRPADWVMLPEPGENEMYILMLIPDGTTALLSFAVDVGTSGYVKMGNVENGEFKAIESVVDEPGFPPRTLTTTLRPGTNTYQKEVQAKDFSGLTDDGMKQAVLKVEADVLIWEPRAHRQKSRPADFRSWNIVEIDCRLPRATRVICGGDTAEAALGKLRYFTWRGANGAEDMSGMFENCAALLAVRELDTTGVTAMSGMFAGCAALTALPATDTSAVTDMSGMFRDCGRLTAIPDMDTSAVGSMNGMFDGCGSLTSAPELDTSAVTDMGDMFRRCGSLMNGRSIDVSRVTGMDGMFEGCYGLTGLTVTSGAESWTGADMSLEDCALGRAALVALIGSLPVAAEPRTLTLTGNPGAASLSAGEKAVATEKNWTLTI